MRPALIAAPALALASAQMTFFDDGAKDFAVTPQTTKPVLF
jgi:hypothetical protein